MLELYQYDLSDIWDQDLDTHGEYGYALDRFANQGDCQAFVVLVEGHYAGFALVDQAVKIGTAGHWMDQFFILKKYRRRGLGKVLASHVFSAMPGAWEVGQMPENRAAQEFWRKIIADYTAGNYQEQKLSEGRWQGFVQSFVAVA
jgi:predicted acetyltransferase